VTNAEFETTYRKPEDNIGAAALRVSDDELAGIAAATV
jgi:hypothetical protein